MSGVVAICHLPTMATNDNVNTSKLKSAFYGLKIFFKYLILSLPMFASCMNGCSTYQWWEK